MVPLPELLGRVRAGWPVPKWEWDGRFDCVLSTVPRAQEAKAREALIAAGLPGSWTAATLSEAPASVREVCSDVGGLLGAQAVFAAELADGTVVYCLWWPWGNGANVSARIGATRAGAGETFRPVLRSAFGMK